MSEVKLLPLPEWDGDFMTESEFREQAQDYARANLAERDAEMEALRAEVELWRHKAAVHQYRRKRLADALRYAVDNPEFDSETFDKMARAALEQEAGR